MTRRELLLMGLALGGAGCHRVSNERVWSGVLFQFDVSITFSQISEKIWPALSQEISEKVAELEQVFSLYFADSALSRLNRDGVLKNPPKDLVILLEKSLNLHEQTEGFFDPAIVNYSKWLERQVTMGKKPTLMEKEDELQKYKCFSEVGIGEGRILLPKRGGKYIPITLNAVVQGYITDQIAALLSANGVDNALIDMGEYRALGGRAGKRAWQIKIKHPRNENIFLGEVGLRDRAMAVSSILGRRYSATGGESHLVNPNKAVNSPPRKSVVVFSQEAATADVLATALAVTQENPRFLENFPRSEVYYY